MNKIEKKTETKRKVDLKKITKLNTYINSNE
jgi:hypothetical protein